MSKSMDNSSGPKSWLDSIHSFSPYLAWIVSRVGFYTRDVWFVVPALAISFVVVGFLAGFDVMIDSIFGLLWVFPVAAEWAVENPWPVFGFWAVTFVIFAWDMEWWTYDELESSESELMNKVAVMEGIGFFTGMGIGILMLKPSLGSLLLVGSVYVISMWVASGHLWKLMVFDEKKYNVRPLKSLWLIGTRVPLVFGVISYMFSPWSGIPAVASLGISLLPPLFVGSYFVWRFKAFEAKPTTDSDEDDEMLSEADEDEFYDFEV